MRQDFHVLFLEDSLEDFELVLDEVKKEFPDLIYKHVTNKVDFKREIESVKPALVISDYSLPTINGMEAISIVKEKYANIPMIIVTGSISEEIAVDCMKNGADDYVLKDNLVRLNSSIKSALVKKKLQSEKDLAILKLQENEKYYRTILNQMHEDIMVIDRDYTITDINNSMLSTTGHKRQNVIGKPCYEISHSYNYPCEEEGDLCPLQDVFKTGKPISALHTHISEQGEKRWVDLLYSPLIDGKGKVFSVIESARDVTDMYKMQKKLEQNENKYRSLVEKAGIGILIDDISGNFKYYNDVFCGFFGYTPNEIKKQSYKTLVHPDDYNEVKKNHDKRMKGDDVSPSYDFKAVKKDGSVIHLHTEVVPIEEDGKIIGTRSYFVNITDKVKALELLKESEEKYRLIVENAHDGIEITQNDKIIFTNSRFAEMLGYTVDELTDITFSKIFTDQAKKELKEREKNRNSSEEILNFFESTFMKKDGSIIDVDVKCEIINYKGNPATFAIVQDITDRKKAETELRKRNKELEIFNDATVGREIKIIELKKEINKLLVTSNQKAKYEIPE